MDRFEIGAYKGSGEADSLRSANPSSQSMKKCLDFRGSLQEFEKDWEVEEETAGLRRQVGPLVSVVLNGRVVWEDYLRDEDTVSVTVETEVGSNALWITPINRPVTLEG